MKHYRMTFLVSVDADNSKYDAGKILKRVEALNPSKDEFRVTLMDCTLVHDDCPSLDIDIDVMPERIVRTPLPQLLTITGERCWQIPVYNGLTEEELETYRRTLKVTDTDGAEVNEVSVRYVPSKLNKDGEWTIPVVIVDRKTE